MTAIFALTIRYLSIQQQTVMDTGNTKVAERPVLDAISSTTTATTISELNKYQIQRKRDGSWMPMYAMTKKQREILK